MHSFRRFLIPVCAFALAGALVACGGNEDEGSSADAGQAAAPATPEPARPDAAQTDPPTSPMAEAMPPREAPVRQKPAVNPMDALGPKQPWPEDLPEYPGAQTDTRGSPMGTMSRIATEDPPEKVMEHYRARFAADGWEVVQDRSEGPRHLLAVRKGDRTATLNVTTSPSATQAVLLLSQR